MHAVHNATADHKQTLRLQLKAQKCIASTVCSIRLLQSVSSTLKHALSGQYVPQILLSSMALLCSTLDAAADPNLNHALSSLHFLRARKTCAVHQRSIGV